MKLVIFKSGGPPHFGPVFDGEYFLVDRVNETARIVAHSNPMIAG